MYIKFRGALVERHIFVGIQGFLRGEKASFLIVARYDLAAQEHDGQVDAVPGAVPASSFVPDIFGRSQSSTARSASTAV